MLIYKQRYKPRTTREFTKSDLTVYDSAGNTALNALTVYGKSEVVDGAITSAGEGWATVDLGTLVWNSDDIFYSTSLTTKVKKTSDNQIANALIDKYTTVSRNTLINEAINNAIAINSNGTIQIRDTAYTDDATFKSAMSGVLLCYQLADPTQGNTIAIKTDNGTGINGTMAVFETGTPLYGVSDTVRDVMAWDGSSGEVTKVCGEVDLGELTWSYNSQVNCFISSISNGKCQNNALGVCTKYESVAITHPSELQNKQLSVGLQYTGSGTCNVLVKDTDYTTVSDFVASLGDAELIYELATSTTEQLTTAENASIAGLRTFEPQTHAQNNAQTEMTVDYTIKVPTI